MEGTDNFKKLNRMEKNWGIGSAETERYSLKTLLRMFYVGKDLKEWSWETFQAEEVANVKPLS